MTEAIAIPDSTYCESWGSECPYCHHKQQWTGDPIGNDGDQTETDCEKCEKTYIIQVNISVSHEGIAKENIYGS